MYAPGTRVAGKWAFAGDQAKQQVSFAVGDVLVVQAKERCPKGWAYGHHEGSPLIVGYFPEAYVQPAPTPAPAVSTDADDLDAFLVSAEPVLVDASPPPDEAPAQQSVADFLRDELPPAPVAAVAVPLRIKWAFRGDPAKRQLVLPKDALVSILRYYPELGWSFARAVETGEKGFVPNNYLDSAPGAHLAHVVWAPGDVCYALHSEGVWQRARVLEVIDKGCRVAFLDDGTEKRVPTLSIVPDHDEGAGRPPALARQSSGAPQLPAARVAARETGRRASDGAVLTSSLRKALPVPPADATPDQQQPQQRGLVAPRPVSAALAGNDKDALWEALLHRVGSATPQSNSASPRTNGTSSPLTTSGGGGSGPAYHVGDVVWSRSPDGQWLRGEIVGQVDRGWEVVVERDGVGTLVTRGESDLRPSKNATVAGTVRVSASPTVSPRVVVRSRSNSRVDEDETPPPAIIGPATGMRRVSGSVLDTTMAPAPDRRASVSASPGIATWKATATQRKSSAESGGGGGDGGAYVPRVIPEQACPVYLLDGTKRTLMVRPAMTARELCVEVLSKYGMEHLAADVVLVSVVKDTLTVVKDATPLAVKTKWPLVVSSNKAALPQVRFVVRCLMSAGPGLRKLFGDPLPTAGLPHV